MFILVLICISEKNKNTRGPAHEIPARVGFLRLACNQGRSFPAAGPTAHVHCHSPPPPPTPGSWFPIGQSELAAVGRDRDVA